MKRIALKDLTPLELDMLKFHCDAIGYDAEAQQYIHKNLYRSNDGIAYYCIEESDKRFAIKVH